MFLHEFKYYIKKLIKDKYAILWTIIFPIGLGTLFYFAFSNIFETANAFHSLNIAIVENSNNETELFDTLKDTADSLTATTSTDTIHSEEVPFFKTVYTDEKNATELLKNGKITGVILIEDDALKLLLDTSNQDESLNQSILESFVTQFQSQYTVISDIAKSNPEKLPEVLSALENSLITDTTNIEISFSKGNMDNTTVYFFNLIAMACMFTSFYGSNIAFDNQANLSEIGKRKGISPTHKAITMIAELLASILAQFLALSVNLIYVVFILKIDFGPHTGLLFFTNLIGCLTGVSFGFFIGSLGHMSQNLKTGILVCGSLFFSFLSGLMVGNIRMFVEKYCPILNQINPTALLADSFYSLGIYDSYDRYITNIVRLILISSILILGGYLAVRRSKYASL